MLRGTITTGTQQAVHTIETMFKFLASLSELDGAREGLYQPRGSLYATTKRHACDSPSTEL